jgi:hypothetical protein
MTSGGSLQIRIDDDHGIPKRMIHTAVTAIWCPKLRGKMNHTDSVVQPGQFIHFSAIRQLNRHSPESAPSFLQFDPYSSHSGIQRFQTLHFIDTGQSPSILVS